MSKSDNELSKPALPDELVDLENELRMLQPRPSAQLDAADILAKALDRERSLEAPTTAAGVASRTVVAVACVSAILSSALTAVVMLRIRSEPEVVERVVYAPGEDRDVANTDTQSLLAQQSETPLTQAVVWSPVGSRAAELRQLDLLLQTDADREQSNEGF